MPFRRLRQLPDWLNQRDVLIVKADRPEPLVVLRMGLAMQTARAAEHTQKASVDG